MAGRRFSVLLIADGTDTVRQLERRIASDASQLQLHAQTDPERGLAEALGGSYDAVLLDFGADAGASLGLLRRASAVAARVPIIVLHDHSDNAVGAEALRHGAADCLPRGAMTAPLLVRVARHAHERSETSRRLEEREAALARVAGIVESSDDAIIGKNLDGVITSWNGGASRLYGYRADEIIGRCISTIIPPERADELRDILARVAGGQPVEHFVTERVRKDGTRLKVSVTISPVRDSRGEVVGASAIARDVTERVRLHEALVASEARFRKLAEVAFDGIVITVDGIIRDVNAGFERLLGWSRDEVIGRSVTEFLPPDEQDAVMQRIREGFEGTYEVVALCKGGSRLTLEVAGRNDQFEGHRARISALRDVTERRLLEEQLRQAQKMDAVGRLAGGVAHDFNNILTVIMASAGALREQLPADGAPADEVRAISEAAANAAALTRQLLLFSRRSVASRRLVYLEDIVESTSRMLRRLLGDHIELVMRPAPVPNVIAIDPTHLQQTIVNLAVNARDAMPRGGRVLIETSTVDVDAAEAQTHDAGAPGRFAVLAITDSGEGMDATTKARIFEPFFTTKAPGSGTGLGLAAVYGIVRQSGGFILVDTDPGRGTSFRIHWPLADGKPAQPDDEPAPGRCGSGETVLVVEDAAPVRDAVCAALIRRGFRVLQAACGSQAVAIAARLDVRIDAMVADVVMPGIAGRDLADAVRRLRPAVKVLYMSGHTEDTTLLDGVATSEHEFIHKPFTPDALAARLRFLLDR